MHLRISAVIAAAALLPASALAETRTYSDLAAFEEIEVSSGINANVTVGGDQSVEVEATEEEDFDQLRVTVRNGRLSIGLDRGIFETLTDWLDEGRDITATISVPSLTEMEASSGADISGSGVTGEFLTFEASSGGSITLEGVDGEDISASASSGGWMAIAGTCDSLEAEASSGGDLDLARLECRGVSVEASSGGAASVFASESVEAGSSSGGSVTVAGKPGDVEIDSSFGGDIDVVR